MRPKGLTVVTPYADADFETYSEAGYLWDPDAPPLGKWRGTGPQGKGGIAVVNAAVYAAHPSTHITELAYNLKDGRGDRLWMPGCPDPEDLKTYVANGGLIEAWNSGFEYYIWHYQCMAKYGWPPLSLDQLRCAMAKSAAFGLPGALDSAGQVTGAIETKDREGTRIMRKLSRPRNPTKNNPALKYTPENAPEDYAHLATYCVRDIKSERSVSELVPDLSPTELEIWKLDQKINTRGVAIDLDTLHAAGRVLNTVADSHTQELRRLTGIPDLSVNQVAVILEWCRARGYPYDSLNKDIIKTALDLPPGEITDEVRHVLQIRRTAGSAGVKKLLAIYRCVSDDGRLRELFTYYGARHTGRFAGRGAQPQNIPASGPEYLVCPSCGTYQTYNNLWCVTCAVDVAKVKSEEWDILAVEKAIEVLKTEDVGYIKNVWGDPIALISGCLRGLFSAAPGYDLICSDFSAIEAVVLAIIAGEQWRIDIFNTHGKIYESTLADMLGVPLAEILQYKIDHGRHHPDRKKLGKIPELASGFGGWINAWLQFGAGDFMTEEEIKVAILKWRAKSPNIVEFWGGQWRKDPNRWHWEPEYYGCEGAAVQAILNPGTAYTCRYVAFCVRDDILYCALPSGRYLIYHKPRLSNTVTPFDKPAYQIVFDGYNSDSTKGPVGWVTLTTYGGKLVENITQAIARDILTHSMLNIERSGYPIVLHVHDEIVSEILRGLGSVEQFEAIMGQMPPWAEGWPVRAAGGWRGYRYRKD